MIKWIIAIIGFFVYRIPGAILGFFIGSFLERINPSSTGRKAGNIFREATSSSVSPADFELNLLSLCSIVIKADGKVTQQELDYVRGYFVSTYGKNRANAIFKVFNEVIKKREVSAKRVCDYMNQRTRYEVRLQLLHFLFGIAQADGGISALETAKIQEIASYLKVNGSDFESIKAMFVKSADTAYKILEIEKSVSDSDVKKAYRTMAKKYHPDRVVTDDQAIKKGAEEKFKKVQEAYETIQKEREI